MRGQHFLSKLNSNVKGAEKDLVTALNQMSAVLSNLRSFGKLGMWFVEDGTLQTG
jgi:hypothetical protein